MNIDYNILFQMKALNMISIRLFSLHINVFYLHSKHSELQAFLRTNKLWGVCTLSRDGARRISS